jgi:hypothetical protein
MNLLRATAAALPAVLLAVQLAGCAGPEPVTGVVTGRLMSEGGRGPGRQPMAGTVAFVTAGQRRVTVQAGKAGTFSVQLPPGRYQVSGPCLQSFPVTVTAHRTSHVNVICLVRLGAPPSS